MPVKGHTPAGMDKLLIKPSWWAEAASVFPIGRTDPREDTFEQGSSASRVTSGREDQHHHASQPRASQAQRLQALHRGPEVVQRLQDAEQRAAVAPPAASG